MPSITASHSKLIFIYYKTKQCYTHYIPNHYANIPQASCKGLLQYKGMYSQSCHLSEQVMKKSFNNL